MPSINCFTRYRSQRRRWGLMIIFLRLILRIDFGLLVVLFILRKDFFIVIKSLVSIKKMLPRLTELMNSALWKLIGSMKTHEITFHDAFISRNTVLTAETFAMLLGIWNAYLDLTAGNSPESPFRLKLRTSVCVETHFILPKKLFFRFWRRNLFLL